MADGTTPVQETPAESVPYADLYAKYGAEIATDADPAPPPASSQPTEDIEDTSDDTSPDLVAEHVEADGDEEEAEQPEEAAPQEPQQDWVSIISTTPSRIGQVPPKERGKIIEQVVARARDEVLNQWRAYDASAQSQLQQAFLQGQLTGRQRAEQENLYAAIDQGLASDPDKVYEFFDARKDVAKAYFEWKQTGNRQGQPQAPQQAPPQPNIQQALQTEFARLNELKSTNPTAHASLTDPSNWDYPATPEGVFALRRDIDKALRQSPKETGPDERVEAAKERQKAPKVEASNGRGASVRGKPTLEMMQAADTPEKWAALKKQYGAETLREVAMSR